MWKYLSQYGFKSNVNKVHKYRFNLDSIEIFKHVGENTIIGALNVEKN